MTIERIPRDDYGYYWTFTVTDEDGTALNISDASSVTFKIGRYLGVTNTVKTMTFDDDGSDGKVKVKFSSGDIDTCGYYDAEIQVNYASGRRTTKNLTIQVVPDLD